MLSKNRIYTWIFLLMLFPGQILSCQFVKYADELATMFLLLLLGLEVFQNGWQSILKLRSLWLLLGIGLFYTLYSIFCFHYNSPLYVVVDLVSQIKPFVPFVIVYELGLELTPRGKAWGRWLCWANYAALMVFWVMGRGSISLPFGHIVYFGAIMYLSAFVYLYCSIDGQGRVSQRRLVPVIVFLLTGILSTRSKYYGECLVMLAALLCYRPGIFRRITLRHVMAGCGLLLVVVLAAWQKISYYFIEGSADMFEASSLEEMSEAFARPILYYVGGLLLVDFFPFGPGLASFASYASSVSYSGLYFEYGLDKVWGLSPSFPEFICDAYYPTLCQFGAVGVALFVYFWYWAMRIARRNTDRYGMRYRYHFVLSLAALVFVLIESVGGTLFIQGSGMQVMMLFGMACAAKYGEYGKQQQ